MAQIIFITQAVDIHEPVLATAVDWVRAFAQDPHINHCTVLALRTGFFDLPPNVTVCNIRGRTKLGTLINFYRAIISRLFTTDFFFIHMGGHYPLMLLPFRIFFNKPIYQWKTHTYISPMMKLHARFCDTLIFTATEHSFPYSLSKVHVVGHGTNIETFKPLFIEKDRDFCVVGRITPVKRLKKIIDMLECFRSRFNISFRCDLYGPTEDKDQRYRKELEQQIAKYKLENQIIFQGATPQAQLPATLNRYKLFISFNAGGLDKAVLEAFACGVPVVTPNICVADILPAHLKSLLILPEDDINRQAEMVRMLMSFDKEKIVALGEELRAIVVRDHSITTLVEKIMRQIYFYG